MKEFDQLVEIVNKLRGEKGCPWDKEQTHTSLIPHLIEESQEVIDTLIREDYTHLKEELGDLLLQIIFHSQIEKEKNNFTIKEVLSDLCKKLVRRHPHVFGEKEVSSSKEVIKLWEEIKSDEKRDKLEDISVLDKIPKSFEPLLICLKYQKEAAKLGFDWKDYNGPLLKINEELKELKDAINEKNIANIEHEIGDIIFALVNLAKFFSLRADVALTKANKRFYNRFHYIEKKIKESGKEFKDFTLEDLDVFWEKAKEELRDNIY